MYVIKLNYSNHQVPPLLLLIALSPTCMSIKEFQPFDRIIRLMTFLPMYLPFYRYSRIFELGYSYSAQPLLRAQPVLTAMAPILYSNEYDSSYELNRLLYAAALICITRSILHGYMLRAQ